MDHDEDAGARAALDDLPGCLTGQNRPLQLQLGTAGGISDDLLLLQRIDGTEAICEGLELRLYCLSMDASLPLKGLIGVAAQVLIVTDRGDRRRICGIVTEARQGESDGGLATYQLVVRDALSVLDMTATTRVFLNKTELQVVQTVLQEARHDNPALAAVFDFETDTALSLRCDPVRRQIIQCNEDTGAFVRRLLRRRGISWFFRPAAAEGQALMHTMVLFHDARRLKQSAAGRIRFHRDGATEERDTIHAWCGVRTLRPGRATHFSWDHGNPRGTGFMTASAGGSADQGPKGNKLAAGLDRYLTEAPHVRDNYEDLCTLAQQSQARLDFESKCYLAEGGVRDCAAGEYFGLDDHPDLGEHADAERDFIVVALHITGQNNLPKGFDARVARLFARNHWQADSTGLPVAARNWFDSGELRFLARLTCVRRDVPFVPAYDPRTDVPHPPVQSAIVVGPSGEEVHCDTRGCVKVRLAGTRTREHAHADGAGASDTDGDSAWVRVGSNWAGTPGGSGLPFGTLALPRPGTEVLLAFLGGDPDKPVIIGQLYNALAQSPRLGQDGLPGNRYLSGIRSREIRGSRANQLRLDDTAGQISAQLASDHGRSELNLGWLTQPRQNGAGVARGEGAELATDQQLALRAGQGMLLSTWRRLGSGGKQLARDEYLQLMEQCVELFKSLGQCAAACAALPVDASPQAELGAAIKAWQPGSDAAPIGVTSPDGISFATSKAIVSYAAKNLDTVAGQHLQMAAGQSININAGNGLSLFAQQDGLRAIAQNGPVLVQSQHDSTRIDSGKDVRISAKGRVIIMAEELVLVNTAGAYITLKGGGPEIGGPGAMTVKTDGHHWNGPARQSAELPTFGEAQFSRTPRLLRASDGEPVEGMDFHVEADGEELVSGKTDDDGKGRQIVADRIRQLRAYFYRKRG